MGSDRFGRGTDGDGALDGCEFVNGGNPTNASIGPNDTTAPALTFACIDYAGASPVKYLLVFIVPVTLQITATHPTTGHVTVERRFVPRIWDSVTVQRLEPSLPSIAFPTGYSIPSTAGSGSKAESRMCRPRFCRPGAWSPMRRAARG